MDGLDVSFLESTMAFLKASLWATILVILCERGVYLTWVWEIGGLWLKVWGFSSGRLRVLLKEMLRMERLFVGTGRSFGGGVRSPGTGNAGRGVARSASGTHGASLPTCQGWHMILRLKGKLMRLGDTAIVRTLCDRSLDD